LGTGMSWAATIVLVRSLSGILTPAGISAVRSTIGGSILIAIALATGHGGELIRMPLWIVLTLWASIIIAMGFGDPMFFASMDHLGAWRTRSPRRLWEWGSWGNRLPWRGQPGLCW
jgi:hypothetical protein